MEQQIRFCTSADGVRIAYAVAGEGPPLVYICGWPQHLEMEWQTPFSRAFLEALAQGVTLARYDMRGGGLSDRDVSDLSLEALVSDLEAVIDCLNLERFPLLSLGLLAGPTAVAYAARHAERVSHVILCSTFLRGDGITTPDRQKALIDFTAAFGFPIGDFSDDPALTRDEETAVRRKERAAASPQTHAELLRTLFSANVEGLTERVSAPTLVMHARGDPLIPFGLGREAATRLPQATFLPYEATGAGVWRQADAIIPEIRRFLGVKTAEVAPERASRVSGVHTILFTDVEGSTALTHKLGDARAREVMREHERMVRTALGAYGGSEVKTTGDGFMASFTSASQALKCAVAMQRAFAEHNETADEPIRLRMGLNAGEPIAEAEDLFGTAVNLAARIAAEAAGGEILVPTVVRELAAGKGFLFSDRGEAALRGFEDPVRLYEVRWEG
ncbi:MAG TPA: adenylate/guanylate cyclase domain-containing protein [Dehalococcoidia bacterium]|nr:adenylate/guanylate cyclase domain-containing protein [Dehalococcoidia bacterium]